MTHACIGRSKQRKEGKCDDHLELLTPAKQFAVIYVLIIMNINNQMGLRAPTVTNLVVFQSFIVEISIYWKISL